MEFTYKEYEKLIGVLKKSGYTICGYENYLLYEKPVILRHDPHNHPHLCRAQIGASM